MNEARYRKAGVDIRAGQATTHLLHTRSGLDTLPFAQGIRLHPSREPRGLIATTDGIGTKTLLAATLGRLEGLGADLVHHCINDLLAAGGQPLMFLDCIGMHRIHPETVALLVESMRLACQQAGCELVGGETAEMPDVYRPDTFEIVGTMIGLVPPARSLPRRADMQAGDCLVGLPSSGPHTNGYTLIRALMAERDYAQAVTPDGESWGTALLRAHRSYAPEVTTLWEEGISILGIAHITGGGFFDNVERLLPPGLGAVIKTDAWEPPALFRQLMQWGQMAREEAYRVFNMGMGLVLILSPGEAQVALDTWAESCLIGHLESGSGVRLE